MAPKCPWLEKSAQIDLKLSVQGHFWGGDRESGVRIAEVDFVDKI